MADSTLIIEAERLILRGYELKDAFTLFQLVERNKIHLGNALPDTVLKNSSSAASEEYIFQSINEILNSRSFTCGIFLKSKNQLIGQIKITHIEWRIPKCEINYFIDTKYQNKGYATEALIYISRYCFSSMHMRKIFLRIVTGNIPSNRVAEKAMYKHMGLMHNEFKSLEGNLLSTDYYELLAPSIENDIPLLSFDTGTPLNTEII